MSCFSVLRQPIFSSTRFPLYITQETVHQFIFMQKLFFSCVTLLLLSGTLAAQDTIRTLLRPAKVHQFGFYLSPEVQYGNTAGSGATYGGGSFMLMVNNRFAFGVTRQGILNERFVPTDLSPLALRAGFGGGKIEYTIRPASALHITFPLVVGYGYARADSVVERRGIDRMRDRDRDFPDDRNRNEGLRSESVVIQPGINLEANLTRHIKIFAGANYRFAPVVGRATLPKDVLQGASFGAGVKVGLFNIPTSKLRVGKIGGGKSVPTEVSEVFRQKFPNAPANVTFHKENKAEWEAEFEQNGKETSANFTADGRWLETETEVTAADLPAALQTTLSTTKKVRKIERIEKADGTILYEVETRRKELMFNKEGILLLD